jgi:hypothetical protein
MLSSAILKVLAKAILAGEQEKDAVAARLFHVLGRNWRWVRPLAGRYVEIYAGGIRPRRRDLISFLRVDPGLVEAGQRYGNQIKILHWITGPQPMQPVPAARDWAIPRIETVGGLAEWLEVTPSELGWFADLKGLGYKHTIARLEHYHYRVLAKAGGSIRLIEIPKPRLKDLQRRILFGILDRVPSHSAVHGFVKGRSIQTFAAPHVGGRVVLRMDLENFFPSFAGVRVQSFFRTIGYPETVADLLGGLATNEVPRGTWREVIKQPGYALGPVELWHVQNMYARPHLPQGAPSSPSLANLCSYRLDCRLNGLAQSAGATYTRYADDLAFSGDEGFAGGVGRFSTLVAAILNEEGFAVQYRKTRIMRQSSRQHLAGLVTNRRLNVRRAHFDMLKAVLTNCVRQSPETQNLEAHPHFREHLQGRIAFIESVNQEKGTRLQAIFDKIRWE